MKIWCVEQWFSTGLKGTKKAFLNFIMPLVFGHKPLFLKNVLKQNSFEIEKGKVLSQYILLSYFCQKQLIFQYFLVIMA